jgi:hypothetical protein
MGIWYQIEHVIESSAGESGVSIRLAPLTIDPFAIFRAAGFDGRAARAVGDPVVTPSSADGAALVAGVAESVDEPADAGRADGEPPPLLALEGSDVFAPVVIARAAARGPVDLSVAGLLAMLDLEDHPESLARRLGEPGLLDAAVALGRICGHLSALRNQVLAGLVALPADRPAPGIDTPVARSPRRWDGLTRSNRSDSVAALTGITMHAAAADMARATELVPGGRLERTGAAVKNGSLAPEKAAVIADELAHLDDDDLVVRLEDAVLPLASRLGRRRLRDAIRAEIAFAEPQDPAAVSEAAHEARTVCRPIDEGGGVASMTVVGPVAGVARIWMAADVLARAQQERELSAARSAGDPGFEPERIGALRFDALAYLAGQALTGEPFSDPDDSAHGMRIQTNVIVNLSTLLALDDLPAVMEGPAGSSWIDAGTARKLAADPSGTWRRLLLAPDGRLLERSAAYRPPPSMAGFVLARDRTCRFPGCARVRLDIDHIWEFDDGGPTEPANLAGLCRTHHNLKTHRLWRYQVGEDGDALWADRHGNAVVQPAARYLAGPDAGPTLRSVLGAIAAERSRVARRDKRIAEYMWRTAAHPEDPNDVPPY